MQFTLGLHTFVSLADLDRERSLQDQLALHPRPLDGIEHHSFAHLTNSHRTLKPKWRTDEQSGGQFTRSRPMWFPIVVFGGLLMILAGASGFAYFLFFYPFRDSVSHADNIWYYFFFATMIATGAIFIGFAFYKHLWTTIIECRHDGTVGFVQRSPVLPGRSESFAAEQVQLLVATVRFPGVAPGVPFRRYALLLAGNGDVLHALAVQRGLIALDRILSDLPFPLNHCPLFLLDEVAIDLR